MSYENKDERRDLWCAVILQALTDATTPVPPSAFTDDGRIKGGIASARRAARAWFSVKNADFVEVCSLAGLDPEAVAEHAAFLIVECNHAEAQGLRAASPKLVPRQERRARRTEEALIAHPAPRARPEPTAHKPSLWAKLHTVDGITRSARQWAEATGIPEPTLRFRMRQGFSMAEAIAFGPSRKGRGRASNFAPFKGTGAGSAQNYSAELEKIP